MAASTVLKMAVVALTVCVIAGTPVNTRVEKRLLKDVFDPVKDYASNAISDVQDWLSDDGEAPVFLKNTVDTITDLTGKAINGIQSWFSNDDSQAKNSELGEEMITRGKHLLQLAANLSQKAYEDAADPATRQKIKAALASVTEAATDVVNAGKTVIQNKGKITAAMRQSLQDLSAVAKNSLGPLSRSLNTTKNSVTSAGAALVVAGISAKDSAVALAAALNEMIETSDLISKANRELETVGKNLMSVGKGLFNAGRNIGKSIYNGAQNVAQASGLWTPSESD
ncbi:hypothetical protein EGW08_006337 [Elysia chlorotica]|uniref:Uncharacterized protein n=1 Tax=Elysia chlorotica TaxID=188477 RepID=A0A3S1BKJ5_ELYCH|nr:hypothetical protein EGW08_006337 [Elysia chlorotica]